MPLQVAAYAALGAATAGPLHRQHGGAAPLGDIGLGRERPPSAALLRLPLAPECGAWDHAEKLEVLPNVPSCPYSTPEYPTQTCTAHAPDGQQTLVTL